MLKRLRQKILSLLVSLVVMLTACAGTNPVCHSPAHIVMPGSVIVSVNVYIAKQFTEQERANIINGILMWQRATNGLLQIKLVAYDASQTVPRPAGLVNGVEERTVLIQRASSHDEWVIKWDKEHAKPKGQPQTMVLGICYGSELKNVAKVWLVENRLTTDGIEVITAAHEFGHAMNLDHVSDTNSTMSKQLSDKENKCVTKDDLHEFCSKHDCDPSGLAVACKLN